MLLNILLYILLFFRMIFRNYFKCDILGEKASIIQFNILKHPKQYHIC